MVTNRFIAVLAAMLALSLVAITGAAGYDKPIVVSSGAAEPTRIVSLSPTATEDLFAIGAGPQVIAVDDQSNYPANAPKTKLSGFTPNAEAIAAYQPDLVVISNDSNGLVKALGTLHIRVLLEPAAATFNDAYAQMVQLGQATGHLARSKALVAKLRGQMDAIVASLPKHATKLSVYHELEPDYYSVTSKTFIGQVYTTLGLHDIADAADKTGSGYPKLSAEYIVSANPDLIVLADSVCCGQTAAKVGKRPGWQGISAVKNGGVIAVSDDVASRWGPRIVDFVRAVAAGVRAVASK
jgi:iron complex transport system substrate-binding protein